MTAVNCQPHQTQFKQCSQLFCIKPYEIHRPTLMEFLSSTAAMQHLRCKAIGMQQNGSILLSVTRQFDMSKSLISRNHHQRIGKVTNLPWNGHPRSTTKRHHLLVTNALREGTQYNSTAAAAFNATEVWVTTQAVRNRLHVAQLHACCPNIVLPVNANHHQARRGWCWLCQRWTVAQWSNVIFSDMLKFILDFHDGQQRVWCWTGKHYQPPAMIAHDHYGGGSVMVREGITMTGRTKLHLCCRRMSLGSTMETMSLSLLMCPMPVGMGMHSSVKTTMQEVIIHMLLKIT